MTVSNNYLGARYFKCDLQMQTPMDSKHWREDETKLHAEVDEDRKKEVARLYLQRCHEVGLEIVAITDHNFAANPNASFVKYLREQNDGVASALGKAPLTIFPGFEIEADVGTGCHVLCLFPPDVDLHVVDGRLTECGLPPDSRFEADGTPKQSTKRLEDILRVVQRSPNAAGIVICPHPFETKGVLNDTNARMWLQQEEFRNPALLCIEIPKPVDEMPPGLQKLIGNGPDCMKEWKRERPIACVSSSDCYRLNPTEEEPYNYIGFRHTWIKMSIPSIESLRQAFIDHESRIRLCDESPDDSYDFPQITGLDVSGASFLRTDPIKLSPNLNCLIGGRGAGKSTLLDYIRLALDRLRSEDLPQKLREDIEDRIAQTLKEGSSIIIEFSKSDVPYRLEYTHGTEPRRVVTRVDTHESDSEWDIRTLFPIRILSQREIDQSVDKTDRTALAHLLDGFVANELKALEIEGQKLKNDIASLNLSINTKTEAQGRRPALVTEKSQLEVQVQRLGTANAQLEHWALVESENAFLNSLTEGCKESTEQLRELIDSFEIPPMPDFKEEKSTEEDDTEADGEKSAAFPHEEIITTAASLAADALDKLKRSVAEAISAFEKATYAEGAGLQKHLDEKWIPVYRAEEQSAIELRAQMEEEGEEPEAYLAAKERLVEVNADIKGLQEDLKEIQALNKDRGEKLASLRAVWARETELRVQKASELMARLRPSPEAKPLVDIEVKHQADVTSILGLWSDKLQDKRRLNEDDIRRFIDVAKGVEEDDTPLAHKLIACVRNKDLKTQIRTTLGTRADTFFEIFNEKTLRELEVERARDNIIYNVYRQDGSLAGPIERVSVGQKGLAFLNLLLASGVEPLFVDTPEEGLDNEGVYTELVPVFRREKEKRQIVVISHNANIPVNGDAELIAALEAAGTIDEKSLETKMRDLGKSPERRHVAHCEELVSGKEWNKEIEKYLQKSDGWSSDELGHLTEFIASQRQVHGQTRRRHSPETGKLTHCVGALDKDVVKTAVQDIMEGSEYAFRKRWEKYGF